MHRGKWVATLPAHAHDVMRPAERVVQLDDNLCADAVHDVCDALLTGESAAAASSDAALVKHYDMQQMRDVCVALGADFDRWIRPRFRTLGALERCRFAHSGLGEWGDVRFLHGRVRVRYCTRTTKINGVYDYAVHERFLALRAPLPFRLVMLDAHHLRMLYGADRQLVVDFVNATPHELERDAPPAVVDYGADELE